jgi:hypothetical protein
MEDDRQASEVRVEEIMFSTSAFAGLACGGSVLIDVRVDRHRGNS